MKKILLSLITLTLFGFANAQSRNKGTFEITPKIGTSRFSESTQNGSTKSNSGAEFGVTGDYYFNNRWSLRSGFIFDKMGAKYSQTTQNSPNYITFVNGITTTTTNYYEDKLNYMSIPINANWHFGSTRKWNLNFGLSPSFLTNADVVENGITYNVPKDIIKSFQLGLTFGIGYKIEVTKKFGILLDFQGFSGLSNISKVSNTRIQNAGGSFNVGGVFQL